MIRALADMTFYFNQKDDALRRYVAMQAEAHARNQEQVAQSTFNT